ncbi:aldehyde dehydrogenase family protein [Desertimonas flava]|uniref:aldehyde dehydrogenase family protein n=1 Tax=Desertimonas flava TaxID=2064846 RepID=UPI0019699EB5|nr:aldehyde dehydrogenase family protein [Desertimonas flava]
MGQLGAPRMTTPTTLPATFEASNIIGGERVGATGGATFERRNPARSSELVSVAPASTAEDVRAAVDAALDGLATWRRSTPTARADVLTRASRLLAERTGDIAAEMVAEEGKPLADARNEASRTPKNLELYAGEAYRLTGATFPSDDTPLVYSVLDPVGVVAVITPWNFPLNMASRKIAPALAAGNAVVFKPSPMTPWMGERLATAFLDAGLPPGVLNVVHGFDAGAHLVADQRVGAITFTGSTAVGRRIHDTARLGQRLQLELGGKNPVVVLEDADIDAAADVVARSSFSLTGQACTGAGRILVHESIHDQLVDAVIARAERHVLGAGETEGVTMGPLIDESALDAMGAAVSTAVGDGATVVTGGQRAAGTGLDDGWFFPPTVLVDVAPGSALATQEVFGPVIGVERIGSLDEAIASANAVEYGLSAAICTRSLTAAQRFAAEVEAGMVRVNRPTVGAAFNAPFGGIKQSGTATHREQLGPTVMDFYTVSRTVWLGG